jgi:hypothetical protein
MYYTAEFQKVRKGHNKVRKAHENVQHGAAKMAETAVETPPEKRNTLKKRGRPAASENRNVLPEFFKLVAAVPKEDWGTRAFMYVYVTEPVCDLKSVNNKAYLVRSMGPILDLQGLMEDYGSFKGFMTLNRRKSAADGNDLIDKLDFEIYNPKYPPKIPREAWANDPRNKRWEALLPAEVPQPQATGSAAEMLQLFLNMQDQLSEQSQKREQGNSASEILDTATKLIELTKPKADATDPWAAAEKILSMRSENPMVTILMQQLTEMRKEAEAARQREFELQKEMRQPKSDSGGLMEQLKNLAALKDTLKTLWGLPDAATAAAVAVPVVRSRMSGTLEFLQTVIPQVAQSPIMNAIAHRLMNPMPAPPPGMQPPGAPVVQQPAQQPANTPQQDMMRFIVETLTPAMLSYLEEGADGSRFAEWLYAGYPDHLLSIQTIKNPAMMPGQVGAPVIMGFYRQPMFWQRIAGPQSVRLQDGKRVALTPAELPAREAEFQKFVEDFCKWSPDEGEETPETATASTDSEDAEEVNV